jgi:ABC-type transporter Mla MlaB component
VRPDFATAIRPGEHACCRFGQADDRHRLALAFARTALDRGERVIYLSAEDEATRFIADLGAVDVRVNDALERGQLEMHSAESTYVVDGSFDPARMRGALQDESARARADEYPGLSMLGDMAWALSQTPGRDRLVAYEQGITAMMDADISFLCIYDHGRFDAEVLSRVADSHQVDVSPELAQLARVGYLAASRVLPGPTLRLAGELDFGCAETLAGVLDAHYPGTLRVDLADLAWVDVTGLRALRGRNGQRLTIAAASEPVRKLLRILGWDTDPAIELAEAT